MTKDTHVHTGSVCKLVIYTRAYVCAFYTSKNKNENMQTRTFAQQEYELRSLITYRKAIEPFCFRNKIFFYIGVLFLSKWKIKTIGLDLACEFIHMHANKHSSTSKHMHTRTHIKTHAKIPNTPYRRSRSVSLHSQIYHHAMSRCKAESPSLRIPSTARMSLRVRVSHKERRI